MGEEFEDEPQGKSRSQKKRESSAAQDLGTALTKLAETDLRQLDVPDSLIAAIRDWKNFPGHEAKRRQMQFIGKLMREMDSEILRERLEGHLAPSRESTAALHAVEKLRDDLVSAEPEELEKKLAAMALDYPGLPAAQLRHLAVSARDERAKKRPPKAYRELFKLLREITANSH